MSKQKHKIIRKNIILGACGLPGLGLAILGPWFAGLGSRALAHSSGTSGAAAFWVRVGAQLYTQTPSPPP